MADANSNVLNFSLPGGGLSLSFDLGPNAGTIANNAYGFLNSTISGANAFEADSIHGTQQFLGAQVAPIMGAVGGEMDHYFSDILGAFNTGLNAQSAQSNQAINAEQSVVSKSIDSSSNSSGGGSIFDSIFGGCFITTAVCKYSGLPDDTLALQTMRHWRDTWMRETVERRAMVETYYIVAPVYVAAIDAKSEDRQRIIYYKLASMIVQCCICIIKDDNQMALAHYLAAVEFARVMAEDN